MGYIAEELEVKREQMPQDKISLLLPVHNEGGTIQKTILEFYQEIGTKIPIEIIVCEDGSTDGTKEELLELSKQIPIKLVLGDKRKGYLRAVKDGLNIVNSDLVLFADSDGQRVNLSPTVAFAIVVGLGYFLPENGGDLFHFFFAKPFNSF